MESGRQPVQFCKALGGVAFGCDVLLLVVQVLLKRCFTSTETVGLLGTGAQDGHLDFHTAP